MFIVPVRGPVGVSSYMTRSDNWRPPRQLHGGIDLTSARLEAPEIIAAAAGRVVETGYQVGADGRGYGNYVIIQHINSNNQPNGFYTLYAHLSTVSVVVDQTVILDQGTTIGTMGNTGLGFNNTFEARHLHFEIVVPPDPNAWNSSLGPNRWRYWRNPLMELPELATPAVVAEQAERWIAELQAMSGLTRPQVIEILRNNGTLPNQWVGPWCFAAGTMIDMADGTQKPIEQIRAGDWVVSVDEQGQKVAGRVTRTFQNYTRNFLDLHSLKTTPGHAFRWGDGPSHMSYAPIIDILRVDGAIVDRDGNLIRAATNCAVGSIGDQFIWAVAGPMESVDSSKVAEKARLRLGTRFILQDGSDWSILDIIKVNGWVITEDELLKENSDDACGFPFPWCWSNSLPRPEDYVLKRSGVTISELYEDGEWEDSVLAMTSVSLESQSVPRGVSPMEASALPENGPPAKVPGKSNRAQRRASYAEARRKARRTFRGEPMH